MRTVIGNAFSINMLKGDAVLRFTEINLETVIFLIQPDNDPIYSIIGHQGTADLLTAKLGREIKFNRENYKKEKEDRIIVCLPTSRLEEGKVLSREELDKTLVKFWLITE